MEEIGIVGAGPAGIFTAINAKSPQNRVILLEKNEKIGKKLFITGKGKCNLTNARVYDEFMEALVRNKKFFYGAFNRFDNYALMDFFEGRGLALEVQRGERVFPKSGKSSDVIKCLETCLKEKEVDLRLNEEVSSIKKEGEKFLVRTNKTSYAFDKLVLATGGLSYSLTGSTGDGYRFWEDFGQNIVEPRPGLCPIRVKDSDISGLVGISLRNISLNLETEDGFVSEFGDLLFAHRMITGPTVLTASSLINRTKVLKMWIDLKPALSMEKLDSRILRDFSESPNLDIDNCLKKLLINALIPVILERAKISPHKKVNEITKKERLRLGKAIKNFSLTFDRLEDIDRAIITSGGVDIKGINPKTMEAKKVPGLYVVGELLDLDALTGGYNLQIAWSTAHACGRALKEER